MPTSFRFQKIDLFGYGVPIAVIQLITGFGCGPDQIAPECFTTDELGNCIVPAPRVKLDFSCPTQWPVAAVGARFSYIFGVTGDSGPIHWEAFNLPAGLSMTAATGEVQGAPELPGRFPNIVIRATDTDRGVTIEQSCGEIEVGAPLTVNLPLTGRGCIEPGMSLLSYLEGGDGSPFSCTLPELDDPGEECPLGRGNGVMPAGLQFDETTCQVSGSIDENYTGTWLWMVELHQAQRVVHVPYCASHILPQQHNFRMLIAGEEKVVDEPLIVEFDPLLPWSLDTTNSFIEVTTACSEGSCNRRSISFRGSCSPLDVSLATSFIPTEAVSDSMGKVIGFRHPLKLSTGDQSLTDLQFANRPWITTIRNRYCLSSAEGETPACETPGKSESWMTWSILAKPISTP